MKKPADNNKPSSALIPLAQSLPATFAAANVGGAALVALESSFQERQKNAASAYLMEYMPQRCLSVFGLGITTALPIVAAGDPAIANLGLFLTLPSMMAVAIPAGIAIHEQNKFQKGSIARRQEWIESSLKPAFKAAQKQAYQEQKLQLIAAADQHLGNGGLLALKDGAWLANLDPGTLAGATEQLAITALQIRKLLAHERCTFFNADGSKSVAKPAGFASQALDPSVAQHRTYIRKQLVEEDSGLAEDRYPILQEGELVETPKPRGSLGTAFKSFFIPFYARTLRREYEQAQLPRFKDVEPQLLAPVADFAAALERYESQNRPLDLPAMRGWKSAARKPLPAPGRVI